MTKTRAWRITGVTQQIAWWSFLVSSLFTGGVTWLGGRAGQPLVPPDEFTVYHGSYEPLNGVTTSKAYATSLEIEFDSPTANVVQAVSLTGFAVLIITSIILAVFIRRLLPSAGVIVAPLIAAAIVAVALPAGRWDLGLDNTWAMVAVLAAIGIHLLWTHALRTRYGPTSQDA